MPADASEGWDSSRHGGSSVPLLSPVPLGEGQSRARPAASTRGCSGTERQEENRPRLSVEQPS